jgi:oligopeptide/dipeptide ABC transporter ATP-binding protein
MSHRIAVMYLGRIVETGAAAPIHEQPLHPYTKALMGAAPSLRARRANPERLKGEPPDPSRPPSGCSFHPRCPIAQAVCAEQRPELVEWRPGRFAACHFALGLDGATEPAAVPGVDDQGDQTS